MRSPQRAHPSSAPRTGYQRRSADYNSSAETENIPTASLVRERWAILKLLARGTEWAGVLVTDHSEVFRFQENVLQSERPP